LNDDKGFAPAGPPSAQPTHITALAGMLTLYVLVVVMSDAGFAGVDCGNTMEPQLRQGDAFPRLPPWYHGASRPRWGDRPFPICQHNGVGDDVLQCLRRHAERRNPVWREEQAVRTSSTDEQSIKSRHSRFNERSSLMWSVVFGNLSLNWLKTVLVAHIAGKSHRSDRRP